MPTLASGDGALCFWNLVPDLARGGIFTALEKWPDRDTHSGGGGAKKQVRPAGSSGSVPMNFFSIAIGYVNLTATVN